MDKRLMGKVALITGAGNGIGRGTALAFAASGAKVVVSDIDEASAASAVEEIRAAGGQAIYGVCDVSDAAAVDKLFNQTLMAFGRIDCAFNNAGVDIEQPGEWGNISTFDRIWAVNGRGVFLCMRKEIEVMVRQGDGVIVNQSSVAGLTGVGPFAYTAAKHAVVGMTRSAAITYASKGIRINCVCPGAVNTAMNDRAIAADPAAREFIASMHPLGRIAEVKDVADAVVWLCSGEASFITGHALPIDGGYMAQ